MKITHSYPYRKLLPFLALAAFLPLSSCQKNTSPNGQRSVLLNVSYDPTREFYVDVNAAFSTEWQRKTGKSLEIKQSHGGSGKQARSVVDGLEADVVTLALAGDIDVIAEKGLLSREWSKQFPDNSAPYTSTVVFVVRKGNPKNIKDWNDLVQPGVQVITPNPKVSGGARWNYLAAWAWAEKQFAGDEKRVREYIGNLIKQVPVWDTGARAATTTFAQREIGDVYLSWENEAYLIEKEFPGKTEIVYPSLSILAEPPVAVVDQVATKHGTLELSRAYLEFLYTPAAQELAAKHHYRPRLQSVKTSLPPLELATIEKNFGGWEKAQKTHFSDGGIFDQLYVIP
ncbi:MAG: sulfate ABC transporter substrate-binding protein [Akkermansiaceae bacterium]